MTPVQGFRVGCGWQAGYKTAGPSVVSLREILAHLMWVLHVYKQLQGVSCRLHRSPAVYRGSGLEADFKFDLLWHLWATITHIQPYSGRLVCPKIPPDFFSKPLSFLCDTQIDLSVSCCSLTYSWRTTEKLLKMHWCYFSDYGFSLMEFY